MSIALWPMAKTGSVEMPVSPASMGRKTFLLVRESSDIVVHSCPFGPRYCRGSSHT